jgi:hypothetical protein
LRVLGTKPHHFKIHFLGALIAALLTLVPAPSARAAELKERDFYTTIQDALGDFEYDLKNDLVKGAQNLAIRDVVTGEKVPRSFRPQLETMITEKMIKVTKSKIILCTNCEARRLDLKDDKIVMTSARINQKELARLAKQQGIDHFLNVVFDYHPTGIVIDMTITDAPDGRIVWSKSYNSETSRAALLRRGFDMDEMTGEQRRITEYPPIIQYRLGIDYLFEPATSGSTGCLGFFFRMVERYDNRKKEIGFEFEYLRNSATLINSAAASATDPYGAINLTAFVLHAWNFLGSYEDLNSARASAYIGIGGTSTVSFLGALIRGGFEWRLGKHFATSAHLGYRPSSTLFLSVGGTGVQILSGLEYGGGLNFMF